MEPIRPGSHGRCPHCTTVVQFLHAKLYNMVANISTGIVVGGKNEAIGIYFAVCPHCHRIIVSLQQQTMHTQGTGTHLAPITDSDFVAWPLQGAARPIPPEVPEEIAKDYRQAALVLNLAPEASAALSRRCLQAVLRDQKYNQRDLKEQIAAAKQNLPSYVAEDLDHIRLVGNRAAHPSSSTVTGEIIEVESGEAEWNLYVLDLLFDFYYVQPAKAQRMRAAAQAKQAATRKSS